MARAPKKMSKKEIKADLLDQLERKCVTGKYYIDMVDDYMDLYDTKNKLILDIKLRGVSVEWNNGDKQSGYKKNDSVDLLLKVNGQMLKVLDALGIEPCERFVGDPNDLEM